VSVSASGKVRFGVGLRVWDSTPSFFWALVLALAFSLNRHKRSFQSSVCLSLDLGIVASTTTTTLNNNVFFWFKIFGFGGVRLLDFFSGRINHHYVRRRRRRWWR
jgi:hypothetical protein